MSNYEFLKSLLSTIPEDVRYISIYGYVALIIISIVAALLIAHLYLVFFDSNSTGSRIHRAFPLIGPAVTTIFLTVQFSLPLSLGLLGALSIVRFRTPIKEPEEIGFILLVIACSISIATYNVAFAALLYLIVFAALFLLRKFPGLIALGSNAAILNILITEPGESSMATLDKITDKLNQNNILHTVSSIHSDGAKTNVSILLKKFKPGRFEIIKSLTAEFRDLKIDYYNK
ncbi:MAG: hypothetical protein ACI8P9_001548 [Parasphingorhabdus sp.]|jgi:hypothetical protein